MTWHYAMSRERTDEGDYFFAVREVYLNEDGTLKAWSDDSVSPFGETLVEAVNDLALMIAAVNRFVLDLTVDPTALVDPDTLRQADRQDGYLLPAGTQDELAFLSRKIVETLDDD